MDKVYGLYNKHASEKINLKKYFEEFDSLTNLEVNAEYKATHSIPAAILSIMQTDITPDNFAALSEYCSVENLTVPGEVTKCTEPYATKRKDDFGETSIPEDIDLKTLQDLKERIKIQTDMRLRHLKYRGEIFIRPEDDSDLGPNIEPGKEILVFFRFYYPYVHMNRNEILPITNKLCMSHVFSILGSQTLDELRDIIPCISDSVICTDISDDPNQSIQHKAKEIYNSGFFFIEDTFYNDFRDASNLDYSKTIRDWAESRNLGPFNSTKMEGVRIDSLTARFGYPWVYQHQGSCEHLFVIMDARLVGLSDNLSVSKYPRIDRLKVRPTKYCMMCGVYSARWITTDNDQLPHDPCFFCEKCFFSYNYIDNKKIGKFKAYPYAANLYTPFEPKVPNIGD